MSIETEMFHHQVAVMTVGQLRAAMEGVPDEVRVRVFFAETPGGATVDEQVAYSADHDTEVWYPDARRFEEARKVEDGWFSISADFKSGDYERPKED